MIKLGNKAQIGLHKTMADHRITISKLRIIHDRMIGCLDQGFDNVIRIDNNMINDLRAAIAALEELLEIIQRGKI